MTKIRAEQLAAQPRVCLFHRGVPQRQVAPGGIRNADQLWVRELADPDEDDSYYSVYVSDLDFII